jgi:hypothetical protein
MHDGIQMVSNETPSVIDGDMNGFPLDRLSRQYLDIMMIDDTEFVPANGFDW